MFTLTITKRDGSETETQKYKTLRGAELALLDEKGWESARFLTIKDASGTVVESEYGDFAVEEDGEGDE